MPKFGMGQSVSRKEDNRLVSGRGEYTDDNSLPGQAYSVVLRSPHAHARIAALETAQALSAPGVLAVLTAADATADGLGTQPCFAPTTNIDGSPYVSPPHALLAGDSVRHVGDPVAFIVAETREQAREAADLVEINYDTLPAVTETAGALVEGAPQVWPEAPNNLCVHWAQGDAEAADAAFAKAAHVATLELINNRLVVNSMEARAALGAFDPETDRYTLTTGTQGVSGIKAILANMIFQVPEENVRVITGDVGGGFGMKGQFYAEMGLVLWASKRIGRPVKWTSDRSEAFLSDIHGRDHATTAELALDADGKFLGMRVSTIANMGAYLSTVSVLIPCEACQGMHTGVYDIPAAYNEVRAVFTHSVPVDAYRGAGRPEAAYMIERLVDVAARVSGIDSTELRRRNYIKPEAMPYTTSLGLLYDSGEFARNMDEALAASDWNSAPTRRTDARRQGKLRGVGMAYYIETCGGPMLGPEDVTLRVDEDRIAVLIGTQSSGQGHETAFSQLVCEDLGVDFEQVELITGDSDVTPPSMGTAGSRSLTIGGGALGLAAKDLIEKGRGLAEHMLEVASSDIEFADGAYTIAGTDRRVSLFELAAAARTGGVSAPDGDAGLFGRADWVTENATYPNGCHICEVEIDADTGAVEIVSYILVDDFGKVINPLLLAGQIHGGIAQGAGQALMEVAAYDTSGQLLTGSFMDYAMPRAQDFPMFGVNYNEIPCTTNPLGIKGAGEAGSVGAPPAIVNAIVNALSDYGIDHIEMPVTAERIWEIINRGVAAAAE